jgi:hypothetical protein
MPRVSFTAAEQTTYEPLPEGRYHVRIEDAKWETSKSSGNQQLRVVLRVLEEGAHYDKQTSEWITHTPKTGWKFGQLAEAALEEDEFEKTETGATDQRGRPTYTYEFDTDDLPGAEMMVQATVEEDQKGNARNRFRFIPRKRTAAPETVEAAPKVEAAPEPVEEAPAAEAEPEQKPARRTSRRRLQA